jgi:hypothetical protein
MSLQKWTREHPVTVGVIAAIFIVVWMVGWMWMQGYPLAAVLRDNGLRLLGVAAGMGLIATVAVALVARFSKDGDDGQRTR